MGVTTLIHPVDPKNLGDLFGALSDERRALGLPPHRGVDYSVPKGTPLKAVGRGTIVNVYFSKVLGWTVELRTYVTSDKIRVFSYSHLDKVEVKLNDKVQQGDIIGHSGNSGLSTGPHLHLMCGFSKNLAVNGTQDPLQWLPKVN